MTRARALSGSIGDRVRAHPIGAFCVWFFPVAWTIAMLPFLFPRPFGLDIPFEVFLSAATVIGGVVPVVVITRMIDGEAGIDALLKRLQPPRASIGWYLFVLFAVPIVSAVLAVMAFGVPSVTPSEMLSALFSGLVVQTVFGFLLVNLWEEMTWMGFVQARLQTQRGVLF